MVTRAQMAQANQLNNELDHVNAALAALQQVGSTASTVLELVVTGPPDVDRFGNPVDGSVSPAFRMRVSPSTAAIVNLLTNRQSALQTALAALGVTA